MNRVFSPWLIPVYALWFGGCDAAEPASAGITRTGNVQLKVLDEISGIQASRGEPNTFFVLNDGGKPRVYAIDAQGRDLGHITLNGADNRDWEDIASIPGPGGRVLVIGDIGDNRQKHDHLVLYLIDEPRPGSDGRYGGLGSLLKQLTLRYPDGAHDLEAMAYDPLGERLLFLTKRDRIPRLYALTLNDVWSGNEFTLKFLGTVNVFRPPVVADLAILGKRAKRASQPTGMDISADGSQAAVITYRSLYHFNIGEHGDWLSALQSKPVEIIGPPGRQNEAVTFTPDGRAMYVTSEGRQAPVYRIRFLENAD